MRKHLLKIIFLFLTIITLIYPLSFKEQQQEDDPCQNYDQEEKLAMDGHIEKLIQATKNLTFSSVKEKYLYIYHPLISECLEKIGQEFEPFIDSVMPAGISAASMGIVAGTKLALTAGLWKTGILGFMKMAGTTILSTSVLPLTLSIGALTFMYKQYEQNQIKEKCKCTIKQMQRKINEQQLALLIKLKDEFYLSIQPQQANLQKAQDAQKHIRINLVKYTIDANFYTQKYLHLKNYFKVF